MSIATLTFTLGSAESRRRLQAAGWVSLLFMVLAGSTSTPFAKQLTYTLAPLTLVALSELISLSFNALSFGLIPLFKGLLSVKRRYLLPLLSVSIINGILAPVIVFTGLHETQAINAELFMRSQSFILFALGAFVLREKVKRSDILASVCVLLGILVISLRGFTGHMTLESGDMLIILGAIMYAFGGIIFKKHLSSLHPEIVLFGRSLLAIICFLAVLPFMQSSVMQTAPVFDAQTITALAGYGLISIFLCTFSFYEAMERLPVHTVSLFLPLISVGSVAFAHIYLGEPIEWYHVMGGALILFGSLSIQLTSRFFARATLKRHLQTRQGRHIG